MNNELDKKLVETYPKIFRNRYGDPRTTAMCWGFEIGDGWFDIINGLCSMIQSYIDYNNRERLQGLLHNRAIQRQSEKLMIISKTLDNLERRTDNWIIQQSKIDLQDRILRDVPERIPQVIAVQVKEKFGTLRFYYNGGDRYTNGLVDMAEKMTAHTCEECGDKGTLYTEGWMVCRCQKHRN